MSKSKLKSTQLTIVDGNNNEYIVHEFEKQGFVVKTKEQLKSTISKLSSSEGTIIVVDNIIIDEDITVPENVMLKFYKGGKLTVNSGCALTLDCAIDAGLFHIFDGDGAIDLSKAVKSVVTVDTIKELVLKTANIDGIGCSVNVLGYHEPGDDGGGYFYWDANEDKANHNGGTIIDPNIAFPTDWSNTTQQSTWFTAGTGTGCWKRIYDDAVNVNVNVKWFGAKGDKTTDDTYSIQAALDYVGEPDDANSAYIRDGAGFVKVTGICRITDTIRIPAWVTLYGDYPGAITDSYNQKRTKGSVILADFMDEDKPAVAVVGKWLSDGRWIDLTKEIIGGSHFDNGDISRRPGVSIRNLVIATDGDVKIGLAIAGADSFTIRDVTITGFLNGVVANSCFGITVDNLNIRAKHVCWMGFNIRGGKISGYFSGTPFGQNTPNLDGTTALPSFYMDHSIFNPPSIKYLTTCLYERYSAANSYKVILESMERAIAGFNIEGVHYDGAYIEATHELPIHMVGANCVFTSPYMYLHTSGILRVSSHGSVSVINPNAIGNFGSWDYGSQQSYGAVAQFEVQLTSTSSIRSAEKYTPAGSFKFLRNESLTIYISSTGNDENTGLNMNNPVATLPVALARAGYYGADFIKIEDGANITGGGILPKRPIKIYSNNGATISFGDNIYINTNIDYSDYVAFENLTLTSTVISSSISFRGLIRIRGQSKFNFSNTTFNISYANPGNEGIFINGDNVAGTLSVEWGNGVVIDGLKRGKNSYSAGDIVVMQATSPLSTIPAESVWESYFRVLN